MSLFDLLFALVAVSAVTGGYRAGFTTRVLSWVGLGVGLVAGVGAVPLLLDHVAGERYELVVAATIGIVIVLAVIGEAMGSVVGLRVAPRSPRGSQLDRVLGGVAGFFAVLATVWMVLPVLAASTGWSGELVADSAVARLIADRLPHPPDVEAALRRLGGDRFPLVFDAIQPPVAIAPPVATGLAAATTARVAASVVKIEGVACRFSVLGTGFVVSDGLVVTNAHVVAGERTTSVRRDDNKRLPATVVAFDPNRDLALLSVPGLSRPALPVGQSKGGDTGGVFGHPGGGQLRVAPFEVARNVEAFGKDIYGTATAKRDVLELAANLQHGDSGAALVDARGDVVGVAFAISTNQTGVAYAVATSELDAILRARHDQAADTGPCLN